MDGNVKELETREYLKHCQKHWRWTLDNYDSLIKEGYKYIGDLKGAYFDEYGLDEPESKCYLCKLTNSDCLKCPLSGIAWRKDYDYPCVKDPGSVYWIISYLMENGRYEEAEYAIEQFLSMITEAVEAVEAAGP